MATRSRGIRRVMRLAAAGAAAGLLLAGCGLGGGSRDSAPAQGVAPVERTPAPSTDEAAKAPNALPAKLPDRSPVQRSIVYVGRMTIRAENVDDAAAAAGQLATRAGGFVAGDNRRSEGKRSTATLVLRIPADRFSDAVKQVSGLGDELTRTIKTDDVTEAVVDLDTRIASQRASVDRTRVLLARAQKIEDVVRIERELANREAALASLEARQRTLADQVTYSTITVEIVGPKVVVAAKQPDRGFLAGLRSGWHAFLTGGTALLTTLGAILPFVLAIGIPLTAALLLLRRRGRRAMAVPTAAPPAIGSES